MTSHPPEITRAARLAAVARATKVDTNRRQAFDDLTKTAAQVLNAPYALISIIDGTQSAFKSTFGIPDAMRSEPAADSFCQYVIEGQSELFFDDVRSNEITRSNPTIEAKGARAWAGCPIELDGELLGTLCVIDSAVRDWSSDDRDSLRLLAKLVSHEIAHRVELNEARQDKAGADYEATRLNELLDTVRVSFLPPVLPTIPSLDLAAWFEPAADGNMLLGDFYDVFPLGANDWGFVIGDVCGHGAEAARLTSLVRYTLRSAAVHHTDPAEVMHEVDAAVRADSIEIGRFATVCFLRVSAGDSCEVRWARAGHPFPVLIEGNGAVRLCEEANGPPLGIASATTVSSWTIGERTLAPGERLLLYTDGLSEARHHGTHERLGEGGVLEMAASASNAADSTAFVNSVVRQFESHATARNDDMAILAIMAIEAPKA